MSQEMKDLLLLIMPNFTDYDSITNVADYLKKLGSCNLEHINNEPKLLVEEKKRLTEQTQELAFTNYKTFVDTAETSRSIMKDFDRSKESLKDFLLTLPGFVEECEQFSARSSKTLKEKSSYSTIRGQSDRLLELLELPSLMREALNAEDYESALDLFTFVRNLNKRYAEIPIVQNTTSEIMTLWFETLYHLFNQLRYDLPLPQCLQILGYLRRANTVYKSTSEESTGMQFAGGDKSLMSAGDGLHLHFLKARSAWFDKALEEAKNTESSDKVLRKLVELHRIHLFNVLTQHKSIFLSDSRDAKVGDEELSGTSALSCWLKEKVSSLTDILNNNLLLEDESTFESLYNQCMYLCLSFGRVGADMRCVLTPLFRKNLLIYFHTNLEKADLQFDLQMRSYKVPANKSVSRPQNDTIQSGPPEVLLDYYPLAEYCNGMLTILNSIRLTAPLDIVKDVYNGFRKSFEKAINVLVQFYQREQQAFNDIEVKNFRSLCICFVDSFIPYIVKCLSQTFQVGSIAEQLGVTISVLQDSKIFNIDQVKISEPLGHIIGANS